MQGTQLVFCRHVQVTPAQTVFGAIQPTERHTSPICGDQQLCATDQDRYEQASFKISEFGSMLRLLCNNLTGRQCVVKCGQLNAQHARHGHSALHLMQAYCTALYNQPYTTQF